MPCFHYTTWKGSRGFRFVTAGRKRERLSCMAAGIKLCIKSTLMPRISRSVQQRTILWGSDLDFRLYLAIQASLCRHLLHLCGTCVCECVIHCRTGCGISYLCARGLMIKSLCVFLKWRSSSSSDVRRAHSLDVMSKSNNLLFFKMHTKNRGEKQKNLPLQDEVQNAPFETLADILVFRRELEALPWDDIYWPFEFSSIRTFKWQLTSLTYSLQLVLAFQMSQRASENSSLV